MTLRYFSGRRGILRACCPMLVFALAIAPACKGRKVRSRATDEAAPGMASVLNMGDPRAESQLVSGFYGVESGAWRWVGKQFTVTLHPPFGSAQKGAKLNVKLTVPSVVIEKNKNVSLAATVGGEALAPETYTTPGPYVYVRDIPASALTGDSVKIDFQVDKTMPPAPPDIRELGIVVTSIGLESK
jgi:hypothetical protein